MEEFPGTTLPLPMPEVYGPCPEAPSAPGEGVMSVASLNSHGGEPLAVTEELLTEEREYYQEQRAALLQQHREKFALIKGRKLLGVYDSPDVAYLEGLKLVGNVPMLVIQVLPEQPIARFPALQLGLIRADIQA